MPKGIRGRAKCSVVEDGKECGLPVHGHMMCDKHHTRQKRYGDPLVRTVVTADRAMEWLREVVLDPLAWKHLA